MASVRQLAETEQGMEIPPVVYRLRRSDLVRYAGVTGDLNPIHFSDAAVRALGLDDVVAHGLLSMGLGGSYVTEWVGDPTAVLDYSVRFTSPVYVPAWSLTVSPSFASFIAAWMLLKSAGPSSSTVIILAPAVAIRDVASSNAAKQALKLFSCLIFGSSIFALTAQFYQMEDRKSNKFLFLCAFLICSAFMPAKGSRAKNSVAKMRLRALDTGCGRMTENAGGFS